MKLKCLLSIFLFLLLNSQVHATAIFFVARNGAIFVGEDTLQIVRENNEKFTHCKMFVNDRLVVAISGGAANMKLTHHGKSGVPIFDLDPKINPAIAATGSVDETTKRIISAIEVWQNAALKQGTPADRKFLVGEVTHVGLFYFDSGRPMYKHLIVRQELNKDVVKNIVDPDPPVQLLTTGIYAAAGAYQNALHDRNLVTSFESISDPVKELAAVLNKETELSSGFVGRPFTIFRLNLMGPSGWAAEGEMCKANTHLGTAH